MKNKLKNLFTSIEQKSSLKVHSQAYFYDSKFPGWSSREYQQFADQAYIKNVIAHRAINLIAQAAASVPWALYTTRGKQKHKLTEHPILKLLHRPNPFYAGAEFFENIYAYKLISGNAFIQAIGVDEHSIKELHILRPDRVNIVADEAGNVIGYLYKVNRKEKFFPCNKINGRADILHIKNFHPLDDFKGLSSIEAQLLALINITKQLLGISRCLKIQRAQVVL